MGSVFSPYYAWARRRGPADPEEHCGLNVALYGDAGKRWALTERGRRSLARGPSSLRLGPSALHWDGDALTARVDEIAVPLPSRIRGRVRVRPVGLVSEAFHLDGAGRHAWQPLAPCAQVEVALEQPALDWRGRAYLDTNWGSEPLADAFARWHWSRSALRDGATAVLYDVVRRSGPRLGLALRLGPGGAVERIAAPPTARLPTTAIWRIPRETRGEANGSARVAKTLEDTPFYARSLVQTRLLGESVTSVHESLSLDRFRRPWVQMLLPFRMPRRP